MIQSLFVKIIKVPSDFKEESLRSEKQMSRMSPVTVILRNRRFPISTGHGKFLLGEQNLLFVLVKKVYISDASLPNSQTHTS